MKRTESMLGKVAERMDSNFVVGNTDVDKLLRIYDNCQQPFVLIM